MIHNSSLQVAFISSNCNGGGAVARTAYVEELMQYIQVDRCGPTTFDQGAAIFVCRCVLCRVPCCV
jgi:hypothetical protein